MRYLLPLLLFLGGCGGCSSLPHERMKSAAVRLDFANGVCSGTAVAHYAILTAKHCFSAHAGSFKVNGMPADYVILADDGRDHVLVRITQRQPVIAKLSRGKTRQGDRVFSFGNPGGLHDVLRHGSIASITADGTLLIDSNQWRGDSGAGVFNARGELIGVVSGMQGIELFRLTLAWPLAFTKEQWREIE